MIDSTGAASPSGQARPARADDPSSGLRRFALGAAGTFLIWLLLVGRLEAAEMVAGAVVAVIVALVSAPHLALLDGIRLRPVLPWYVLRFAATFLRALLMANVDMARRVLSPTLPIHPALVEVKTELRSPLGRLLLANSITLTPGTLSVDVNDDRLIVHWVDATPGTELVQATRTIAADFERKLKEFLW
jgi:multicomponent Na+:H+ antiporter subunit E